MCNHVIFVGFMYDLTQSYTLSFVVGGSLCIASAIIMVQPYFYVKNRLQDVELDIPEKEALACSMEFFGTQNTSILNVSKMAISLDFIPASHRLSSSDIRTEDNLGSLDLFPATERLKDIKTFASTVSL